MGRLLVIAPEPPNPDASSGERHVVDRIGLLQDAGWATVFTSPSPGRTPGTALAARGIPVFAGDEAALARLLDLHPADLVYLSGWLVTERLLPVLRRLRPEARVLIDSIDLHLLRAARRILAGGRGQPLDAGFAEAAAAELSVYAAADGVLAVSAREAAAISDLTGDPGLAHAVPLLASHPPTGTPWAERAGLLFVGSFRHAPNLDAVASLCREVLPRLDPALRTAHPLWLVGNGYDATVAAAVGTTDHVRPVGWVPRTEPYLARARVFVAPLRFGAGVKGKLVEALASGVPTVTTTVGAEGMGLGHEREVLIADDPAAFAAAIERLLTDEALAACLVANGRAAMRRDYGPDTVRRALLAAVAATMARPPKGPFLPAGAAARYSDRQQGQYLESLAERIAPLLARHVPAGTPLVVAAGGNAELLRFAGYPVRDLPADGVAGSGLGPNDPTGYRLIAAAEAAAAAGAGVLVQPIHSRRWTGDPALLRDYFGARFRRLGPDDDDAAAALYDLRQRRPPPGGVRPIAFVSFDARAGAGDRWEWQAALTARSRFAGHQQPRLPGELGPYDLHRPEARRAIAGLAADYGIAGFCLRYRWRDGEADAAEALAGWRGDDQPSLPFALCWAAEGHDEGSAADERRHAAWLAPFWADPRALTVAGRPVVVIERFIDLLDPERLVRLWTAAARKVGRPGLFVIAAEWSREDALEAPEIGADAAMAPEPIPRRVTTEGRGHPRRLAYQAVVEAALASTPATRPLIPCVTPRWDDTPRRGDEGLVLVETLTDPYARWLRQAARQAAANPATGRLLFLRSWNGWAEGSFLEPDAGQGRAWLEATRRALYLWPAGAEGGAGAAGPPGTNGGDGTDGGGPTDADR